MKSQAAKRSGQRKTSSLSVKFVEARKSQKVKTGVRAGAYWVNRCESFVRAG